jgi:hypothetical protein
LRLKYVENPAMVDDPRYSIAPPWEQARLKAGRDNDLKVEPDEQH